MLDFLIVTRYHWFSSQWRDLPSLFYRLCTLLSDLRRNFFLPSSLLNSTVLFASCLDFREEKSRPTAFTLATGCEILFDFIIDSGYENIFLAGE